MQKTVKHGFSSQEGHLAQMSLPYFSAKGGAVNITKTKEYALAQAHAAALLYHERLEGRSIKIHCEDDLTLAIVWDAGNFAHLCGLDYYLDDSKRCRLPPRKLYEDLLRGRRISPKRVSPHGDVQWLKKKADVLTDAMDMSKVTHVVVSGNSRIVLYAGMRSGASVSGVCVMGGIIRNRW